MLSEADILEVCEKLGDCPDQGSWYRVDLHVHSPASHDFAQEVRPSSERARLKVIEPAEFIRSLADQGLDLVAITDHNTGGFVDAATNAARELAKAGGRTLVVLPGVEITVNPGVHVLAILPDGGTEAIHHLLSQLGLEPEQRGREGAIIERAVSEVADAVHALGGIVIGAHCGSTKGVVQDMKGQARLKAIESLDLLANSDAGTSAKTETYVRDGLKLPVPFTVGSDSHDPRSVPAAMWVKMARPSFNGLRQVLFEPDLRILRTAPPDAKHSRILGMAVTGGLYGAERFLFSPNLNVLIGGRGAGKSAAIDLLRFAFQHEPSRDEERTLLRERQSGFLANVGEVVVHVYDDSGNRFAVVRSGAFEVDGKKRVKFQEKARVFAIGPTGLIPHNIAPLEIIGAEFYGQGEVSKLAERADEQLRLIDDNIANPTESPGESGLVEAAAQLEQEIAASEQEIDSLAAAIAERPEAAADLKDLSERLKDPVFDRRSLWTAEQQYLGRVETWLQKFEEATKLSLPPVPAVPEESDKWPSITEISQVVVAMQQLKAAADDVGAQVQTAIGSARTKVATVKAVWEANFKAAEDTFRERLKELGASTLAKAAEEQRALQTKLRKIDEESIPRREELVGLLAAREARWNGVVKELERVRAERNVERQEVVDRLNKELAPRVRIILELTGDRRSYADFVNACLDGSGMIHREEQVATLCAALNPPALATAMEGSDVAALTTAGLTAANAGRAVAQMSPSAVRELNRFEVPPLVRIQLRREGEMIYTELRGLSVGERCSAVLAIALLNKRRPLIVDQPEDDLDHAFVTESVVESIRAAKNSRQIIAASHNPNIPVLGDAEMVIRVERLAGKDACQVKARGGLELPEVTAQVQMLEGGPDAFERRRKRYGR